MRTQIIVLVGPTASGKSSLAVELSQKLAAPIVNADSRQVYKELNIGVAKPSPLQLSLAPHLLVGYTTIHEHYSAGQWARDARKVLETSFAKAHPASTSSYCIISGGSGLHVKALVEGIPEMPPVKEGVREHYQQIFENQGIDALQQELVQRDEDYFRLVDANNAHRLMRALCVIESSGKTFTELRAQPRNPLPYHVTWVVLDPEREALYKRINSRVDDMILAGLEKEAQDLRAFAHLDALKTIGYQEWWPFFDGIASKEDTIALIKQNTRHYARRQSTWNRKIDGLRLTTPELQPILDFLSKKQ